MKFLLGILTSLSLLGAPALAAVNGRCSGSGDTSGYYGICISTSSCRANGGSYVNNRCPNDPENIKCCTIAGLEHLDLAYVLGATITNAATTERSLPRTVVEKSLPGGVLAPIFNHKWRISGFLVIGRSSVPPFSFLSLFIHPHTMFEFPGAKRVRRSDLQSRRSSRSPSPPDNTAATYAANALQNIFSSIETYTPPTIKATHPAPDLEHIQDEEEEQEFEFRLFHAPPTGVGKCLSGHSQTAKSNGEGEGDHNNGPRQIDMKDAGIQKFRIKLRSPTPTANDGVGGFVAPFRGWEYYFSDPEWARRKMAGDRIEAPTVESDARRKERFVDAAVNGETILEWANKRDWPGCYLSWRVTHLQTTPRENKSNVPSDSSQTEGVTLLNPLAVTKAPKSRKKPGKKRRIILRRRLAATRTAEAAEREKRTRRNREKKIKKKLREKEKKATLRNSGGEQGESAGS
ncbi:hypothetical protein GX51_00892 [Blastomyces parvus]|uniref:Uncharacterized protein n=1 Tax=Blastomyces parvus TaxID=2060905 RepID=A0A2B7XKJ4_9EURO|nr:hypothetical protein GX51_00892 [Blastomyces parvus]